MKKWIIDKIENTHVAKIFLHQQAYVRNPENSSQSGIYDVVRCASWVNIVAITDSNQLILVKQYRVGADDITTELPAGAIDRDEEPLLAAKRELEEETGYISDNWTDLGSVRVNPAFMTNHCYFFLAENAKPSGTKNFDPMEDIELSMVNISNVDLESLIREMDHSLAELCLRRYLAHRDQQS